MNYNINHIQLKDLPLELIQFRLQEKYDQDFQKAISSKSSTKCASCGSKFSDFGIAFCHSSYTHHN